MQIANTQYDEQIQIKELPFPESVKRYYKTLGPDTLAKLTGKSRKQIISKASELGVAKAPRAGYRSREEREKAQALVLEVHHCLKAVRHT